MSTSTRWTGIALLVLAVVGGAGEGRAQTLGPDTLDLTLEEAYRVAGLSNPTYRQAVNDASLNGAQARTTLLTRVLPQLSLNVLSTAYSGSLTKQTVDFFGQPIDNPESNYVFSSSTGQGATLSWNIQGASLFNEIKRQRLTNDDRTLAADRALWQLRSDVRRHFSEASRESELLALEKELLEARRVDHDVTRRLYELAAQTRVDLLRAELGIEQQALNLQQQDGSYRQALLTLRTTLGDPDLPPIRLAPEEQSVFDPSGLEAQAMVRTALEQNPDMRQARAAVRSAEHGVSESKASWWPNLTASFNVGRFTQTRGRDALFDLKSDDDVQSSLNLRLSIPFFNDYFGNSYQIQEAQVQVDNSTQALRSTRMSVEEQVRGALLTLNNQYESYRLARRSQEIAREALRLAREEYRMGTGTFEQWRQSINDERDTARQVIEARYAFIDALVSLEEVVGVRIAPVPPVAGQR